MQGVTDVHIMPEAKCPYCDHALACTQDMVLNLRPRPGDISLCVYCAQVLIVGEDMRPRKPTDDEQAIANNLPAVHKIKKMIRNLPGRKLC